MINLRFLSFMKICIVKCTQVEMVPLLMTVHGHFCVVQTTLCTEKQLGVYCNRVISFQITI